MATALELNGISKRYGDFQAVDDLSFAVEPGSICGFLGPNGAGKTSTIRMILGLAEPTSGSLKVLGAPNGRSVRDRIGFLPEERGLYRRMTPIQAVAFFAGLKGVPQKEGRRRGAELLEAQGLGPFMKKPMKALSKGMAQKVQLIAAIAHRPELVLLDEPFSGLDPVNQQGLEASIRDLAAAGSTVLFSTHVMQHAERLCEKVVLLARGKKVFEGSVASARSAAPRFLEIEGVIEAAQVSALPGVTGVESSPSGEGGQVHRASLEPKANPQAALTAAFAQGLDVRRFEIKEPSLHDAFIVLTGGHGA
jgi:ABC-2 type transport system ATP-binding protein